MNTTTQLRIRLSKGAASKLLSLPPRARSRIVSFMLGSTNQNLDFNELLQARKELVSLGVLINQALRTSWGKSTDAVAMAALQKRLEKILL